MAFEASELEPAGVDPLLGTLLSERYQIIRMIGEGGMGRVYEAEHVLIKRRVAVKCLHAHYASRADVVARFRREALAATAIHNKHIVEVTDMGRLADGGVFMVLELLDGRDLAEDIKLRGALPFRRAVHIATQICDALHAAHAAGIVHRDLKPENIFLITRDGDGDFVKVVDFGISKFKDAEGDAKTDTGVVLGTPMYMAPEQIQGKHAVDHRADLYALGVILFVALAGRPPFAAPTPLGLVYQVCTAPAPSLREFREDAPPELVALVARLLEKDPEARFADATTLRDALVALKVVDGATPPPVVGTLVGTSGIQRSSAPATDVGSQPTLPATPTLPSPARRAPRVAVALAVLAALAAGLWGLRSATSQPTATTPPPAGLTQARAALAAHESEPGPVAHPSIAEPATSPDAEVAPTPTANAPAHDEPHNVVRREPLRARRDAGIAPLVAQAAPSAPTPAPQQTPVVAPTPPTPPRSTGVYTGPRGGIAEELH